MIDDESREIGFLAGKIEMLKLIAEVLGFDGDTMPLCELEDLVFDKLDEMIGDLNQMGLW